MLQLIYGRGDSGKTTLIYNRIREDAAAGRKVLLLVPKQQVFAAEQRLSAGHIAGFTVEASGFDRLCNQIFRRYGGLCYHYIGKGAKRIVLWRALTELSDFLREYKGVTLGDLSVLSLMQGTLEELERCRISPQDLEKSADLLGSGEDKLKNKLNDLSAIYELDLQLLHKNYDNPEEDLPRACAFLEENDYFSGMRVYIDGFEIYTPQEAQMLEHIFRQAERVCVSVPCLPGDRASMFGPIRKSEKMLLKMAGRTGTKVDDPVVLDRRLGTGSPELLFLSGRLWQIGGEHYDGRPKDITLTEAPDIYAEAEAAACEIARLVRQEGCRYREIAVILRSTPDYEGILDQAFEKYGIPCFASARTRLRMKPQIRLIGSALAIGQRGWRCEDVIAYLRSGITGIPPEDCDLLEEYARTWKISGKLWYSDDPWNMNPSGFTADFTAEDEAQLIRLNELRSRLTGPLGEFLSVFDGRADVRTVSGALWAFLDRLGLAGQLSAEEETLRLEGQPDQAQESVQVWDAILSALDSLVIVAGDLVVDAGRYADLLFTVFDSADIGRIPARADEVLLGDPGLIHRPEVRHAFLLGLCEGVFPAAFTEDTVFGDADRIRLEGIGLELEENSESRAAKELYGVYRAVSAASEKLHLYYHADLGPSVAIYAIKSLFPGLETLKWEDSDPKSRIFGKASAFEYAASRPGDAVGKAILEILSDDPVYAGRVAALDRPIGEQNCAISPKTAGQLMDRGLNLTQSRLENFVKCPFSYYAKDVLRLKDQITDDFQAQDIGNFMHAVFENFFTVLNGRSVKELSDEQLAVIADEAVADYRSRIVRGKTTRRLEYLFDRLGDLSRLLIGNLIAEFRSAEFEPRFFEMPIDNQPGNVHPFRVDLGDGRAVSLYGRVDRVDSYTKDGKTYVRVVDYKTGKKSFSLEDVRLGLNLQMLIYLFSICGCSDRAFREKLGAGEDGEILPAGILYYSARMPTVGVTDPQISREELIPLVQKEICRSGLLLADEDVLRAMDRELSGYFIPVHTKKDGSPAASRSLADLEQFGQLLTEITEKIGQIGREIAGGKADARPMQNSRADACRYCGLQTVCRVSESVEGEDENG